MPGGGVPAPALALVAAPATAADTMTLGGRYSPPAATVGAEAALVTTVSATMLKGSYTDCTPIRASV